MASSCECGDERLGSIKRGESRVVSDMLASQEGLCSMELVTVLPLFETEPRYLKELTSSR